MKKRKNTKTITELRALLGYTQLECAHALYLKSASAIQKMERKEREGKPVNPIYAQTLENIRMRKKK